MAVLSTLYGTPRFIADDFGGNDHPKRKYNFTMQLAYGAGLKLYNGSQPLEGSEDPTLINFGVKQFTRPNINISYEDVNFYNYQTKVATKVDYGVVTVTFYDDVNNRAHDILHNYLLYTSPISRNNKLNAGYYDRKGMEFTTGGRGNSSASLTWLEDTDKLGPIRYITLVHYHESVRNTNSWTKYHFFNPKIQNAVLDELDMSQSDVNTISLTFLYDGYQVESQHPTMRAPNGIGAVGKLT